ncbi:GDSL-type esterase/lipase family protein [Pseudonocardia xinjiangensis]|uniref:SGNH/GDSL hydrolase family protein n=1 Tax=Pseudonocardia xinjiangensis TaxID=75289 RepID=A0ABX1RI16_9PSEU|nr:GDSL-type esterase/lipase family protein [Pseudonocardia xinjiangensis]NMH79569.1 SGNH/GDSL hydrolase family protein [Pseudonocardia xinjiangensis]
MSGPVRFGRRVRALPWPGLQWAWHAPSGLAVAVALVLAVGVSVGTYGTGGAAADVQPVAAPDACAPDWVTGWQTAAQPAPGNPALGGTTLRMVVHPQVTGSEIRLRLSNAYGTVPLSVAGVSAARSDGAAGLLPGTVASVMFGGQPSVVIPAGADVLSDPVPLVAEAGRPLAVSMFLPVAPPVLTQHSVALQTSYVSRRGDWTLGDASAFPVPVGSWLVLTGVDVLVPRPVNAVVTVGDSITDGVGSGPDADERWSDALSDRLSRSGGAAVMSVLNAGIARNRLLSDGTAGGGDSPLTRFDRDVASAAGATDVVLHIGTNDVAARRSAAEITEGMRRFAERARSAGMRVFLTTITPSDAGPHGTSAAVANRAAVNAWVRVHGREYADGVFDFAASVADPAEPTSLAPEFDSGDGLHLSAAGYRAMAAAVDPELLTGSPCLAGTSPVRVLLSGG